MKSPQPIRGTHDLIGRQATLFRRIDHIAWAVAQRFGLSEISTPLIEATEVFQRSLGDSTDIVHKEMYTFSDRNGDSITLRPEGTAGIARAFISNGLAQKLPLRFYYNGPMFRYERPQKGRQRQFHQLGVEILGLDTPSADLEAISMAHLFLKELGLSEKVQLEINTIGDQESRLAYRRELTAYFQSCRAELSEDSRQRLDTNPMRILDSKHEKDQARIQGAPHFDDFLNSQSQDFFAHVTEGLKSMGIDYQLNHRLVRGLDYYGHTVFEFTTTALGAQNAVLAGGRYDQLIEILGGKPTPGVGWASGIERLALLIGDDDQRITPRPLALLPMGENAQKSALQIAHQLRAAGFVVEQSHSGSSFAKLLKKANRIHAQAALILGENEFNSQKITIKDLDQGTQQEVPWAQITQYLQTHYPPLQKST